MKTLTASDRKTLIRLASSMEKGSEERTVILAGLKTAANVRWKPGRKPMETLWTTRYKGSELEVQFDEHEGEWRGFADGDFMRISVSTADEAKEDLKDAIDDRLKRGATQKFAAKKDMEGTDVRHPLYEAGDKITVLEGLAGEPPLAGDAKYKSLAKKLSRAHDDLRKHLDSSYNWD